ncbi:mucin-15 [Carettochelys insculpta]|uniref:mucin-15 n=1 Tax=Carettochelys insculpta TaxID=44489 RepID=UPI003EC04FC1
MLPSSGIILILLLTSLCWTRSNSYMSKTNIAETENSSSTDMTQSTYPETSQQLGLTGNTEIMFSAKSLVTPTTTNEKARTKSRVTMSNTQRNSVPQEITNGTVKFLSSNVSQTSQDATNTSTTNANRISPSSTIPITRSGFPTVTKSNTLTRAVVSMKTESKSTTSVTHTNSTETITTEYSLKNSTEVSSTKSPSNTLITTSTLKSGSVTTDFKTISETTYAQRNFTNHSIVPSNQKNPNKENRRHAGVMVGTIVGVILGSVFIGLIGYFICGKRIPDSFSHRRLQEDTRREPGLRLDTPSYDASFGDLSYYNPSTTSESAAQNIKGRPSDVIPMGDMTPSQPPA